MLKIVVCDDEITIYEQIREHISHYCIHNNREFEMRYCPTAQQLLDTPPNYNLLFLDIMLDNNNDGIEIGKCLRNEGNTALFILTTSRTDRTLDGYEATVFRYLIKPVRRGDIYNILDAAIQSIEYDRNIVAVKFKYQTHYIHVKDIIYVESYLRKRCVVTRENQFKTTATWQTLMEQFSAFPWFFSPKKTHLINLPHVVGQSQTGVVMSNGQHIHFTKGKYEQFLTAFSAFLNKGFE